jgi:hypothetical protein
VIDEKQKLGFVCYYQRTIKRLAFSEIIHVIEERRKFPGKCV